MNVLNECEYCAQRTLPQKRVVEIPMESEAATLRPYYMVIDPARLVFCDAECRQKWHGLRRKALWASHPQNCACVGCMG